jgi:ABC-type transport system involved in Fe-S cluster assembly fused permease/ATPase subunit
VKDAKVLVLDEATGIYDSLSARVVPLTHARLASVDYETDRNIQDTITHEFEDRTILCIARESRSFQCWSTCNPRIDRLSTIISYDRICVLDAGQIAVRQIHCFH